MNNFETLFRLLFPHGFLLYLAFSIAQCYNDDKPVSHKKIRGKEFFS